VFRIVNETTKQPVENPAQRALATGEIVGLANHTILIAQDGAWRPIDDSAAPIKDDRGEIVGCVLVFRDVSERRKKERDLAEAAADLAASEARYRAIGEAIDFGVWMCDAQGRCTYASPSFLRLVGMTQEECAGFGWGHALHPEDAEKTIAAWRQCVARGGVWDWEHRFRGVDGHWHYVLARGVPLRNEKQEVLGWAGINLDIDRLKQAEQALRDADRRKDEFLATLAHELRNPLAPVRNAVQVLQLKGPASPELQWARDVIDRQMQGMTRLIDDLLDLSRISRNKLELRKERIELSRIVQGAIETSRPMIEQHGHELTVNLPPEPVYLDADMMRLAQVFLNLLNNAAKYTEPGGKITFTAERQGSDVVTIVRDSGIGIAPEKLATIFEMFSQVEDALTRAQGGLGIGLSLVKRLVEMHGGSIEAKSAGPGKGSEFTVRLPVILDPRVAPATATAPASKLRILVVDDNRDTASTLAMLLKLMGNNVRTAFDGEEAVLAASEFHPHVVLLDIGLPKMNGYEAARAIRRGPGGEHMVLIAVTGWGQEDDRRKSQDAGFDRHLVKPVDPQSLMSLLAELAGAVEQ
jgi:PAS domain S-box-containing protein